MKSKPRDSETGRLPGDEGKPDLRIDTQRVLKLTTQFLQTAVRRARLKGVVVGLSGGVDSALAAALAVRALGKAAVFPIYLPSPASSSQSGKDAAAVAKFLGLTLREISIAPVVSGYLETLPDGVNKLAKLRRGNFQARARMSVLFDCAMEKGCGVLGTSNKTELMLGYGTWHGDMACSFNPLGDLYKTQIWQLARHLDLPAAVIDKAPTADLWAGQTDESELGLTYRTADEILALYVDAGLDPNELSGRGYRQSVVDRVLKLHAHSHFKRNLPLICKLSRRTIGIDYLYPADWQGE